MFCPYCGKEIKEGGRFCPKCGHQLPVAPPTSSKPPIPPKPHPPKPPKPPFPKKIILVAVAVLALVFVVALIGGNGSYEKKVLGEWYLDDDNEPAFTLYDDGSTLIPHTWGKGTWSITNGDQLSISDFYGQTWIFTIVKVDNQKLVVGPPAGEPDEGTLTYWHSPQQ